MHKRGDFFKDKYTSYQDLYQKKLPNDCMSFSNPILKGMNIHSINSKIKFLLFLKTFIG